jgi:hypothetical protein
VVEAARGAAVRIVLAADGLRDDEIAADAEEAEPILRRHTAREASRSFIMRRMALIALSEETAVAVIATAGMVAGFVALGIVGWIFLRAARRDREAGR